MIVEGGIVGRSGAASIPIGPCHRGASRRPTSDERTEGDWWPPSGLVGERQYGHGRLSIAHDAVTAEGTQIRVAGGS